MPLPRVHLPEIDDDDDRADAVDGNRVSRFDVERFACGELSGVAAARVQRGIDEDPALKAFLDELRADDAAFLLQQPPAAFVARLAAPTAMTPWTRAAAFFGTAFGGLRLQLAAGAMAAVVLVTLVVAPGADDDDDIRTKGGVPQPALSFFVKEQGGARLGTPGESLAPGDQIQLAVKDVDAPALVVLGVDRAGVVSVYEKQASRSTPKGEPGPRPLPSALILDDITGVERFFVVYGDDVVALEEEAVRAAVKLAGDVKAGRVDLARVERLALDDARPQASFHVVKVH